MKPMLNAAPTAPQAAGSTAELDPGIVLEVVELRWMPERGSMQFRFAVTTTTGADMSLKPTRR